MTSLLSVKREKQILALTSNYAAAYAVKAADVDVVAVYPITPQTTIVEKIAEFVDDGELNAELIHVESEHSALSAVLGASAAGARVFTATSSQGLELMHEVLHIASGLRLPIVMAVPARALSAPISIHGDYSDVMNTRDTGWITYIASTAQEVYDTILQAFKVAESALLPTMVAYDGFLMSHTTEPVELNDEEEVRRFLPRRERPNVLRPEKPITMGAFAMPDWYYEIKYQVQEALTGSLKIIEEVDAEYGRTFGRRYGILETYKMEDAEYAIVAYGGASYGNAKEAADIARGMGIRAGVVRLRVFRPFPSDQIAKLLDGVKSFAVVDRAIAFGGAGGGPVFTEVATALWMRGINTPGLSVIHGIGQRAMFVEDFVKIYQMLRDGERNRTIYMGLRI
ncbi:transketolase C-terminal domain-containing protein [Thermoproteus tenax]|uniref:2-oxoacid oxidoreductase (ferredoxin) n=2 Tax=Thermoproteus tenax TaxID=2271 RepID=G4RM52_THETK|nr:transketolase C-terminal domain-containing protein [Thermoproteus tenax]CAF18508.1 putative 2-oxoglutarate synthase, 2-oxoacid:ferredoxin oxidoreductases alpha subunit [Thermoproteus tenax]CCC82647.1 2-oxoacid ferredoxin oxidoreductase, alpha subunit [Thermoproteus tenax Kra 1]